MLTRQSRVIIACIACAVWFVGATDPDQATRRWWNHVRVLASDGMQGRDTGSPGHRKAAEYVAESFKRSGLRPAGDAGYLQPVPLQAARFQADRSSLSLIAPNGRVTPMRWLRDVMTAPRLGLPESFDAELVFEGYEVPADVDINGRILVVLAPPRFVPRPLGYVRPPPPGSRATIMIESPAGPPLGPEWCRALQRVLPPPGRRRRQRSPPSRMEAWSRYAAERRVIIGSTRDARHAGPRAATSAVTTRTAVVAANVSAS
jgi:hypothetical protein